LPAQAVAYDKPSFLLVRPGELVILNCTSSLNSDSMAWYKQHIGGIPQKLGERLAYNDGKSSSEFNISGLKVETTATGISLLILHTNKEDEGFYFCVTLGLSTISIFNGTFLSVTGDQDLTVLVNQHAELDSVPAGESVNLQCSVFSESKTAEHQVLWFRSAEPQSRPQIIYTHHNSSHQCKTSASTYTCVYNFSKSILTLNDTGTYYCAVAMCGKIIFGNGTTVQMGEH
ncbi:uncharacterized protein LOC134319634, partial [Trichomycterus rosablanca]|uniref:uncharacterized protein LOC134319634 n=1 Tax=Trichomycterus rosablanca TaxID=2290929 RepID=UPI002F35BD58